MEYPADKNDLYSLTLQALEGQISHSDFVRLEKYLQESSEYREIYSDLNIMYAYLRRPALTFNIDEEQNFTFDANFWQALAEHEKIAPEIEIPGQHQPELIQKVVYPPRAKRKLSKFSIFMLLNTAAIILFFIFLQFAPPKGGFEVATLIDSLDAKWTNMPGPMEKGARIITGDERLLLREGYAELLFDNHALITVEGPAEFQVLNDDRICLNYGKLYLKIPKEAIGFSVYTQNAKIIDMGTEFGVLAELGGGTQLHVLKGKTMLMAGKASKVNMEVREGIAKKISDDIGEVADIKCRSDYFVRDINSEANCVWREEPVVRLADIVGGGNGLGTGEIDMGIDPISGTPSKESWGTRKSANDYHSVPANPYVDGVFVPNGRTQQIVSTQGHLFRECPVTSGTCCEHIISSAVRSLDSRVEQILETSDLQAHSLFMHANMGITFDLQAIRRLLPADKIVRFQSKFGIRKWAIHPGASNADFWVLVDGELRYSKKQVKIDELGSFDIELSEKDRFLTLIQTDGGDPKERILDGLVLSPNDSDWGIFADPILILE